MKPSTTLKELLKPPFSWDRFSNSDWVLCSANGTNYKTFGLQVTGKQFLKYYENGKQLHDDFKDFVVEALNEKWKRDFTEPERWWLDDIDHYNSVNCPHCRIEYRFCEGLPDWENYKYCPSCGRRLWPPKEE